MFVRGALSVCMISSLLVSGHVLAVRANAQQMSATAAQAEMPSFEVASIKPSKPDDTNLDWDDFPGRIAIENYTLRQIIKVAYGLKSESQVLGGPKWIDSQHFDIAAKADDAETAKMQNMDREQWVTERSLMLQSLLADRFQLQISRRERDLPLYALVITKTGIKFVPSESTEKNHGLSVHNTRLTATGISMDSFADYLTGLPESGSRVVINQTGLTGDYNFKLNWTRDHGNGVPLDAPYPGLFTALEDQLGLKIESQKGSVPVVIVGSAVEPALD